MRTQKHDCSRCHGLMVDAYSDLASPGNAGHDVIGQRCVNCGEYVDRLVLLNRVARQGIAPLSVPSAQTQPAPPCSPSLSTRRQRAAA